jgi:hypothetical protein
MGLQIPRLGRERALRNARDGHALLAAQNNGNEERKSTTDDTDFTDRKNQKTKTRPSSSLYPYPSV